MIGRSHLRGYGFHSQFDKDCVQIFLPAIALPNGKTRVSYKLDII